MGEIIAVNNEERGLHVAMIAFMIKCPSQVLVTFL